MKDTVVSTVKLKEKELSLKTSQAEQAHKLMEYMSDKIGKKLTPTEVYFLSLEMFSSDPIVNNLMSGLEKITIEQQHVTEIVKEITKRLEPLKTIKYHH